MLPFKTRGTEARSGDVTCRGQRNTGQQTGPRVQVLPDVYLSTASKLPLRPGFSAHVRAQRFHGFKWRLHRCAHGGRSDALACTLPPASREFVNHCIVVHQHLTSVQQQQGKPAADKPEVNSRSAACVCSSRRVCLFSCRDQG